MNVHCVYKFNFYGYHYFSILQLHFLQLTWSLSIVCTFNFITFYEIPHSFHMHYMLHSCDIKWNGVSKNYSMCMSYLCYSPSSLQCHHDHSAFMNFSYSSGSYKNHMCCCIRSIGKAMSICFSVHPFVHQSIGLSITLWGFHTFQDKLPMTSNVAGFGLQWINVLSFWHLGFCSDLILM